jgi:hypothetical protein
MAPCDAAPTASERCGRLPRARKRSLIGAEGSSPSWVGTHYALTERRSAPDMSVIGQRRPISNRPSTSGQARSCKQAAGQPIRRARVWKVAAGPMQRASSAKPPRGARKRRLRGAIRPASGAAGGKTRSMKLSGTERKHAVPDLEPASKAMAPPSALILRRPERPSRRTRAPRSALDSSFETPLRGSSG